MFPGQKWHISSQERRATALTDSTYKDTTKAWLFVKLPPVGEPSHFPTYPWHQKAWFTSKCNCT